MNTPILHQKKHTGRNLVLLNAGLKRPSFFKAAENASVKLAHFNDYLSNPEKYLHAFTEGDGVYFEGLNVAVMNFDKEDELEYLNRKLKQKAVLATEPERYVYKIDTYDYIRGYRDGIDALLHRFDQQQDTEKVHAVNGLRRRFTDSDQSTWGIKATRSADSPYTGKGINIAILDTGIYKVHVDLKGRKITTRKFVSSGSSGDADGHGTHCAGVACGFKDEAGLRYGVASQSNIFCGKVLNDQGEGTDSGILAGIEWAITRKCRVISMSLGAATEADEPYSVTYENVATRAMQLGSLIVAAAGNESNRPLLTAPVGHPANCPSIMAVGAVDSALRIAYFSSGGINKNGGQVDIVAPGVSVYSMINTQHEHDKWDGTSMATPFVAGIAGLYFEQHSDASPLDVWTLITQHARRLNLSSIDGGSGLVQAPLE
jgi:subtilisin family serine protease